MAKNINSKKYFRTAEACKLCGISRATLFRWVASGLVDDVKYKDRNGWRLFTGNDIARIKAEVDTINKS